jgi:hypothetical protein
MMKCNDSSKIQEKEGIPPNQHLIFAGKQADFVKTLTMLSAQQIFRLYGHLTTNTRSLRVLVEELRGMYRKNQDIRVLSHVCTGREGLCQHD